jgi:hypothetical protein
VSLQAILFVVGAIFEFVGIVLLGFPDFIPGALRLSNWLRIRGRRLANRMRRLFGRPPGRTVVKLEAADEISLAGHLSLMKHVHPDATIEEKVAFLVQRDQEAQRDVNELNERLTAIETETPRRLEELRGQMHTHVARELTEAMTAYRPLRIGGTVALAIGLLCVTVANFV